MGNLSKKEQFMRTTFGEIAVGQEFRLNAVAKWTCTKISESYYTQQGMTQSSYMSADYPVFTDKD